MKPLDRIALVFDAECDFCVRSLRLLKRFDWLGRVELVPSNSPDLAARFPQLHDARFDRAMYGIAGGRCYAGFDAFRAALWASPVLAIGAWLWYVPGVPVAGRLAYAAVAANRSHLGCARR